MTFLSRLASFKELSTMAKTALVASLGLYSINTAYLVSVAYSYFTVHSQPLPQDPSGFAGHKERFDRLPSFFGFMKYNAFTVAVSAQHKFVRERAELSSALNNCLTERAACPPQLAAYSDEIDRIRLIPDHTEQLQRINAWGNALLYDSAEEAGIMQGSASHRSLYQTVKDFKGVCLEISQVKYDMAERVGFKAEDLRLVTLKTGSVYHNLMTARVGADNWVLDLPRIQLPASAQLDGAQTQNLYWLGATIENDWAYMKDNGQQGKGYSLVLQYNSQHISPYDTEISGSAVSDPRSRTYGGEKSPDTAIRAFAFNHKISPAMPTR